MKKIITAAVISISLIAAFAINSEKTTLINEIQINQTEEILTAKSSNNACGLNNSSTADYDEEAPQDKKDPF